MINKDNNSIPLNLSCLNFTTQTADLVLRVKASIGGITVVVNLLAILLIVISKKYKDVTFRLVIYLLITDILQAVAMCLALSPIVVPDEEKPAEVKNGDGWKRFCAATGFILMTTMWMGNIVIIWIVVHLLGLGWRLYRSHFTIVKTVSPVYSQRKLKMETAGLLLLVSAPVVIGIIPFFLPHQMYGISGLWCWIKMVSSSCGDLNNETLIVVFVFFYGPLVLIVLFSFISMMATIVFVCYGAVRRHGKTTVDHHQRHMKEIMLVLAYPMLYCTVCLLLLANRLYTLTHKYPNIPLWITHTVADPVRVLLPAAAFLLHPYVWRDLCMKNKPTTAENRADRPDQCINVNSDESLEEKLFATQDGHTPNYGGCDDNGNMPLVVESK